MAKRRRGFFAEMAHQNALRAKEQERAEAAAQRERARAIREWERAQAAAARSRTAAAAADRAAAARAAADAASARQAEAEAMNSQLRAQLAELDSLLERTLAVDDAIELETLRRVAEHPSFDSPHSTPTPTPQLVQVPPEPVYEPPDSPSGIGAVFARRRHEQTVQYTQESFAKRHAKWAAAAALVPARQLEQMTEHQRAEAARLQRLAADEERHRADAQARQAEVDEHNARLDRLIAGYEAGDADAVREYVGLVFDNSIYPEPLVGVTDYDYDPATRELTVAVELPRPDQLPTVREYRYVKAREEITSTPQTQKEQRDRYTHVITSLTLRTLHEVFESDRAGHIDTVSLTGYVELHPATGHPTRVQLIAAAVDRDTFTGINLAHVTPAETLRYLHADVAKNPHALAGLDTGAGVRGQP